MGVVLRGWLLLLNVSKLGAAQQNLSTDAEPHLIQHTIRRSSSLAAAAALALASIPFGAVRADDSKVTQGTEAADLGVMGVNLKDAVKFNWGFQGALQGAGTPNETGIGAFIPLKVGENSVFFLDTLANVNFSDFSDYSSIINTKVKGATVSTSTRLGYRWLNKDRSWMFGVNAGYDSRPMATGGTDNGVTVTDSKTIFFQQLALNLEAVSNKWFTSAYLLYPVGEYGYNKTPARINDIYYADSVMTAGVDIGYNLTPNLKASVGYYYSEGDAGAADGNSARGRLEYNIANGLTSGINIAYDPAFSEGYSSGEFYKTLNLSVDIKYRFGAYGYGAPSIRKQQPVVMPVIQALSATPANRDVRVHDEVSCEDDLWIFGANQVFSNYSQLKEACQRQNSNQMYRKLVGCLEALARKPFNSYIISMCRIFEREVRRMNPD
jgi:hypothetical protein